MAWDHGRSKSRVNKEWQRLKKAGITIKRLTREMNLSNLSPTDARLVRGAHIYTGIANFETLLDDGLLARDQYKRLHRYLHVLRVELRRIVQSVFDGDKIQVQGGKFHGLLFKPYDDDGTLAVRSVLSGIVLYLIHTTALAEVFPDYPALIPTIGIELGECVVANVGIRGDRELISVGSAANRAAKALGPNYMLTVADSLWAALPQDWQQRFTKVGALYRLDPRKIEDPEDLLADQGLDWSLSKSVDQLKATLDAIPLDSIKSESAQEKIDLECLGPKHFKTCSGGTLFVDIDGYTALIESLMGDEEKLGKAVQLLHLFRYELRQVAETDANGIVIQHQGDRMQALLHVPSDNEERIKRTLVELCVDCNSSVEEVMNQEPELLAKLHVAIGADFGSAIVLRSGVRGDLDAGCLGHATANAESLQLASAGNVMRISSALYDALNDDALRGVFSKETVKDCYKGEAVTWAKVDDAQASKAYAAAATVAFHVPSRELHINRDTSGEVYKPLKPTRPWGK